MIVPPFFGLYLPYKESSVYGLKHSYLSSDVLTYSAPTNKVTLTYLNTDVLCYDIPENPLTITWATSDILSFDKPTAKASLGFCVADVLTYNPPPSEPEIPTNISGIDGDSLVSLMWLAPYNNRSSLTDYIIEYKLLSDITWSGYSDPINTSTSLTITGLTNNQDYEFRIAAVNTIGTGLYGFSNIVTPSGGDASYCSLKLLVQPDSIDVSSIQDLSSIGCELNHIGIESDSNRFAYGGRSLFFDGQTDVAENPNQFPYFSTSHHFKATRNNSNTDQSYWSLRNNFTIELWIRPDSSSASSQTLMSAYSQENLDYSNYSSWRMYFTNGILYFNAYVDSYNNETGEWNYQNLNLPINNSPFLTSIFTHIAISRSKGYIQCYIDGVEVSKTYFPYDIIINSDYLIIGADHTRYNYYYDTFNINRVYTYNPFIGNIDDILISKAAKYRKGFVSAQHTNIGNSQDCFKPGQTTNLSVSIVDGV